MEGSGWYQIQVLSRAMDQDGYRKYERLAVIVVIVIYILVRIAKG